MKCCEKWKEGKEYIYMEHSLTNNERIIPDYCPTCGERLEEEICQHSQKLSECNFCNPLYKPKSGYCECANPTEYHYILSGLRLCDKCDKPIKPKKIEPLRILGKEDFRWTTIKKINELIEVINELR